jgi:hypothetical protein
MQDDSAPEIKRLFLSVGAMKAGTTWLYDKLRQHPEIYFTPQKEVHFFSHYYQKSTSLDSAKRDLRAESALSKAERMIKDPAELDKQKNWYSNYRHEPIDYEWLYKIMEEGIKNGHYAADFSNLSCFLNTEDWIDVRRHAQKLRILYILRDPISRLWSHFKFHLQFSKHKHALEPDISFSLFKGILEKPWFWRNALYSKQINTLRSAIDTEELRILFFEDMVAEPESFLREVEDFLEIPSSSYLGSLKAKKNKSIEKELPEEWKQYAHTKLSNEIKTLKEIDYWHQGWQ